MSETFSNQPDPQTPPPPQTPDPAIPQRDPQGNLLEPGQTAKPTPTPEPKTPDPSTSPQTSTQKDPKVEGKTEGAPEKYSDFSAPDGYTIDPKVIESATPIFKELGLSQESAQKLVDFHTQQMLAAAKGPQDAYEAMRSDWQAKVKSDPDLAKAVNGDKTGLDAVKLDIGRALAAVGDAKLVADFKEAMNTTGVGDHPAFVKTLWRLASFVTEGKHVSGSGPSPHGQSDPSKGAPRTGAQALYPGLPQ
jgi:hypothetical protein